MRPVAFATLLVATIVPALAEASGTGFDPRIVTFGAARQELKAVPITQRPYRPLHVYGNTVRRRHQRATSQP